MNCHPKQSEGSASCGELQIPRSPRDGKILELISGVVFRLDGTARMPASTLLESLMPDDPASSASARQLAEHHYYAALDLVLEGHHEQAVEEYQQAVAADPKFTDALHGLSRGLQDLSRFDEAIEVAQPTSDID